MRLYFATSLGLLFLGWLLCTPGNYGRIERVIDGDTVVLDGGQRIRLAGIDAPEGKQPFGQQAAALLAEYEGRTVRVVVTDTDRYGRQVADLYCAGQWINRELVEAGAAWHYIKYSDDARLAKAQRRAQKLKAGLWRAEPGSIANEPR